MASFLFTLDGWTSVPNVNARSFNNETGLWSFVTSTPFSGVVSSSLTTFRQAGGWDGSSWYVISPTGGLYAYDPATALWSGPLAGGSSIINGTVEDTNWCMTSDGRHLYILSSSTDFRRYDPVSGSITLLSTPGGNAYSGRLFLVYDASGSIYGFKGGTDNPAVVQKYDIGTNTWTTLATPPGLMSSDLAGGGANTSAAAYLGGKLWLLTGVSTLFRSWSFDPTTSAWASGAVLTGLSNITPAQPFGEVGDSTIRYWFGGTATNSADYNIQSNSWTRSQVSPVSFNQGTNFVVSRVFNAEYEWFLEDGVTPAPAEVDVGQAVAGDVLSQRFQVRTPVSRSGGVTVAVVSNPTSDADDPVTISADDASYAKSFATGALSAGDFFDVYVKIEPTAAQTVGFVKLPTLKITAN